MNLTACAHDVELLVLHLVHTVNPTNVCDHFGHPVLVCNSSGLTSGRLLADGLQLAGLALRRPLAAALIQVAGHLSVPTAMNHALRIFHIWQP